MQIVFLVGFGGRETNERHYEPGDVADLGAELCAWLIANGYAEEVKSAEFTPVDFVLEEAPQPIDSVLPPEEEAPTPEPEPTPTPKRKRGHAK